VEVLNANLFYVILDFNWNNKCTYSPSFYWTLKYFWRVVLRHLFSSIGYFQ